MGKNIYIRFCGFQFDLANITVEPVLFLYMFANFLYFPSYQALIFNKVCLHSYKDSEFCEALQHNKSFKDDHVHEDNDITSKTSYWTLNSNIALTTTSFFTTILFLGPFGDKWGRKVPVMIPCFGALFSYISGLLNAKFMSAPVVCIIVGPIINGLCGGFIACLMAVYSFVGHISSPSNKMIRVGIVEAMIFLAGSVGVFVSGPMLEKGYVATFSLLCISIGVAIIYAAFWLDNVQAATSEMLERESCGRAMLRFLSETLQCVRKTRRGWTLPALILQVLVLDMLMLCTSGDMDISLLYLRENLGFSQTMYGYVKGLDNFMRFSTLVFFLPFVKKLTTVKDLPLVIFGLISYAADYAITGLAGTKWLIYLAVCVGMFKGVPSAGLRATMSIMVSSEEQGRLFGLIAASESVVSLLASLLFNQLYPATLSFMPGLCYLLASGIIAAMVFVVVFIHYKMRAGSEEIPYMNFEEETNQVVNDPAW
ncbi:hypothetical protein EGW08_019406 [Elysia chlorotica]|uniref:Major facilitator superfamily (MFS) profile domain-containing protein n=1 Tax=Elysia chlorotica TaxID=188477 RepID=A0A433SUC2_ELYCH|nr:hypothetical protein EGW08_019406 [Elysia chlorotica]